MLLLSLYIFLKSKLFFRFFSELIDKHLKFKRATNNEEKRNYYLLLREFFSGNYGFNLQDLSKQFNMDNSIYCNDCGGVIMCIHSYVINEIVFMDNQKITYELRKNINKLFMQNNNIFEQIPTLTALQKPLNVK